jgi:hypothetical protein
VSNSSTRYLSVGRVLLYGSFLVVFLLGGTLFVPTFMAQLAVQNTASINATPIDYRVERTDGSAVLLTKIRIHNPTTHAVTLSTVEAVAYRTGHPLTQSRTTTLSTDTVVPAGESRVVTTQLPIKDGSVSETRAAVAHGNVTVSGLIYGEIVNKRIEIDLTTNDTNV